MIVPERDRGKYWLGSGNPWASTADDSSPVPKASGRPKKAAAKPKVSSAKGRRPPARTTKSKKAAVSDSEPDEPEEPEAKDESNDSKPKMRTPFPVVLTTYEIVMRDRPYLEQYRWGFIVVDEGHRLKNFECRLMRELKSLPVSGRMVLTGTPLHVRLIRSFSPSTPLTACRTTSPSSGHSSTSCFRTYSRTSILSRNGSPCPARRTTRRRLPGR